jgi:UDP-N-acetylglucosamine 2-epimerase (non-hydrolysing)/GDP/UDP-N,N'-diacetylbacillosamine 2-epimerase (hydrolysing)
MAARRRICVVTGSRAEYGLLYWLMQDLHDDPGVELQVIVTGMHLSPEFGLTYHVVEDDGFRIDARVEMLVSSDTPSGIAKSIGLGVIGFGDALSRLQPDIVVVLGDRFEIFAAAQAALVGNFPLAHIAGGDTTEGAFDEAIRHSITKMAHLHFVTNAPSERRVLQMGEDPAHVYNFGSPGLDYVRRLEMLDRQQLSASLNCSFQRRNLLITFHPVTIGPEQSQPQFAELLHALRRLGDIGLFFTKPNADTGGRALIAMLDEFVASHSNAWSFTSLGQQRYLSLMAQVDAVVGNSSSGLYEAPSLKTATVNIGERQRGRLCADSVICCPAERESIEAAIRSALELDCSDVVNPYGDGYAAPRIAEVLKRVAAPRGLLQKRFHSAQRQNG